MDLLDRQQLADSKGLPQIETQPFPRPLLDTCECGRNFSGWSLDVRRNMWVCGTCKKPSGINLSYKEQCDNCNEWYTIEVFPDNQLLCPECT